MVNEKIRVGQVLKSKTGVRYKITKVGDKGDGTLYCWSRQFLSGGSLSEESPFGSLTKDGLPNTWGANWDIEGTASIGAASPEDDRSKMMHFFRTSSHPENCGKCGAPKPCSYHP